MWHSTGFSSQGRAKLRAFPRYCFMENTQLVNGRITVFSDPNHDPPLKIMKKVIFDSIWESWVARFTPKKCSARWFKSWIAPQKRPKSDSWSESDSWIVRSLTIKHRGNRDIKELHDFAIFWSKLSSRFRGHVFMKYTSEFQNGHKSDSRLEPRPES